MRRLLAPALIAASLAAAPAAAVAVPAVTAAMVATAPAAHAAQIEICAGGLCINAWGGKAGAAVRMETPGATNEEFTFDAIDLCSGSIYVTGSPGCPFILNYGINTGLRGYIIGQLVYVPTGQCVAATGTTAYLGKCNTVSTGTGGSPGTVVVDQGGATGDLVDRALTNSSTAAAGTAVLEWLASGGSAAAPLYMGSVAPSSWSGLSANI
jgi:hypothetical protein